MDSATETLSLHWLDGAIIVSYLLLLTGIGYYHSRKQNSLKEYFLAGKSIGWLAVGLSLMAALNSGIDYMNVPSSVMQFGIVVLVQNLTWFLLYPLVFFVTLPLYRRLNVYSAYEYLEQRFNVWVRVLTAGIFILWRLGWTATALYVPCLAISSATGGTIPLKPTIVVLGSLVTINTMLGGMKAVIWTEVTQFCIMFGGLAATIGVVLYQLPDGVNQITNVLFEVGSIPKSNTPPVSDGVLGNVQHFFAIPMTGVGLFIAMMVARMATYTSDQVMVQRFQTTRTIKDARKGFLLTAISDALWMTALAFVGLALYVYFQSHELPNSIKEKPDQIFPYFMAMVFPPGVAGLVIAAIFAASLCSVSAAFNSLSSVLMIDFYQRLCLGKRGGQDPGHDPRRQVLLSRIITVLIGVVGVTLSYNVDKLGTILKISNLIINSFTGPILGIFLLGMFVRRANSKGAFVGGLAGTLMTLYTIFWSAGIFSETVIAGFALAPLWPAGPAISFLWPSTFGFLTTMIVGYLVSLATKGGGIENQLTWFEVTKRPLTE